MELLKKYFYKIEIAEEDHDALQHHKDRVRKHGNNHTTIFMSTFIFVEKRDNIKIIKEIKDSILDNDFLCGGDNEKREGIDNEKHIG